MERFMSDGRRHETGTLIIDREDKQRMDPTPGLSDFIAKKYTANGSIKIPTDPVEIHNLVNSPRFKPPVKESDLARMHIEPGAPHPFK